MPLAKDFSSSLVSPPLSILLNNSVVNCLQRAVIYCYFLCFLHKFIKFCQHFMSYPFFQSFFDRLRFLSSTTSRYYLSHFFHQFLVARFNDIFNGNFRLFQNVSKS